MKRRNFLSAFGSATLFSGQAQAEQLFYTEGLVRERLSAGETLLLHFSASWCTTCQAQERVLQGLRDENRTYDEAITFIEVDWDDYGRSDLARRYNVRMRSILLALQGDDEIGRLVSATSPQALKDLMDAALVAATA